MGQIFKSIIAEEYRASGHAGYGSTNTMIPYYTTADLNTISNLGTIVNTSVLGWSFTATRPCIGFISGYNQVSGNFSWAVGVTLNSAELTTSIISVTAATRLTYAYSPPHSGVTISFSTPFKLAVGDVIRIHSDSNAWQAAGGMKLLVQGL